jgi:hypothetical protein
VIPFGQLITPDGSYHIKEIKDVKEAIIFFHKKKQVGTNRMLYTNIENLFYSIDNNNFVYFERFK